jgi:hypothetical protein
MGILCLKLGKVGEAGEIYEGINERVPKKGVLYRLGVGDSGIYTYTNAAMGILCLELGKVMG